VRIARGMAADLERSDFKEGCPIAPTALETAGGTEGLAVAAKNGFEVWEREIRLGLEQKFGFSAVRAAFIAVTALSQLEGALLLARTYRDLGPMRRAEDVLKLLLNA
jgi:TetR/AcrR family transcriptional regulator, lmrAB and yxaGH operons repressor